MRYIVLVIRLKKKSAIMSSNYAINLVRFTHWTHTRTRVFAGYRNVEDVEKHLTSC